jgi:hypothetical protein
MRIATLIVTGAMALAIMNSAASAQQALTGTIIEVNRINSTVAIQPAQSGTVGANTAGTAQEFKLQNGVSLEDWHAGDRVSYSATDTGGVKTITKLQKQ